MGPAPRQEAPLLRGVSWLLAPLQVRVMLPLMDLFNHANPDQANINMFRDENGDYYGYAKRPIARGEQVGTPLAPGPGWGRICACKRPAC